MKRRIEKPAQSSTKTPKTITVPHLSFDLWQSIAAFLNVNSLSLLRRTSAFFAQNPKIRELLLQQLRNLISEYWLDFNTEEELESYLSPYQLKFLKEKETLKYLILIKFFNDQVVMTQRSLSSTSELLQDVLKRELFSACKEGHLQILNVIFESSPLPIAWFINAKKIIANDYEGLTALGYAASHRRKRIFSILLDYQAQIVDPIRSAESDLIFFDLGYWCKVMMTPLHIIALRSDSNWLLNVFNEFPQMIDKVFTEEYLQGLKFILKNDPAGLKKFLKEHPSLKLSVDIAMWTLLHWASCFDNTECLITLIEEGLDVNSGDIYPIFLASSAGKLNAIKTLHSQGANIEEFSVNRSTCLHLTANNGHKDCTAFLIQEWHLDINAKNDYERTPLDLAQLDVDSEGTKLSAEMKAKKEDCAQLLISLGAGNHQLLKL
jgi:ankyrin repeat protein